jgi:hypothetical protein
MDLPVEDQSRVGWVGGIRNAGSLIWTDVKALLAAMNDTAAR